MPFDEVSNSYLEESGSPDQINEFHIENEEFIQWFYYKVDFVVEFVCPGNNTKDGWEISYAISLDPLKYYREK